jgi:hypothetical protein
MEIAGDRDGQDDEDATQDVATWHREGDEATALSARCNPDVRAVVRGLFAEPAKPRGNEAASFSLRCRGISIVRRPQSTALPARSAAFPDRSTESWWRTMTSSNGRKSDPTISIRLWQAVAITTPTDGISRRQGRSFRLPFHESGTGVRFRRPVQLVLLCRSGRDAVHGARQKVSTHAERCAIYRQSA